MRISVFHFLIYGKRKYLRNQSNLANISNFDYVAFVCLKITYQAIKWIRFYVLKPEKDLTKYGKWAVVTGATSGIGEAYAHYLADKGFNILLISRSENKLKNVATSLEKYNVEVEYIVHDFSVADTVVVSNFRAILDEKLCDLTSRGGVGILINSVGVANDTPTYVHEMDTEDVRQMLFINNNGTMLMMMTVLPHMMKRKSGAIITISSGSCRQPMGLLAIYSATKAFGNQLTRSMYYEYKEHGIDVLSITPFYFVSNLFVRKHGTFLAPMPGAIIKQTTKYLGYTAEANPYFGHKLQSTLVTNYLFGYERVVTTLKSTRDRRLAKLETQKDRRH